MEAIALTKMDTNDHLNNILCKYGKTFMNIEVIYSRYDNFNTRLATTDISMTIT